MEYGEWLQRLQSFLDGLLSNIFPDKNIRAQYLTPDAMTIWARAFTHETVSPSDNYEDLEYLGDIILKGTFPKYLMRRLPHLHKSHYTELNVSYMSKMYQAQLSRKLGFNPYIRVLGMDRAILNLDTDVFESFFGALDTISDNITPGSGFINCYNMIIYIFSDIQIDESLTAGAPKTQVQQIFTRFDLDKPIEEYNEINGVGDFIVGLNKEHIDFLATYGVRLPSNIIGRGRARTKKDAESIAYKEALQTLSTLGITTDWANDAKTAKDFNIPSVAPFVRPAFERASREGYRSLYFFIPRKTATTTGAVVQLIGVRADGQEIPVSYIYTTTRANGYADAKTQVISQYASGK